MRTTFTLTTALIGLLTGCGNSVNSPASEAADLASSLYADLNNDQGIETHTKDISSKLKFESITYTYKKEVPNEGTECGWSACMKLEDESRCYIKYTKPGDDGTAEWGIYKNLTHVCDGNDKEDSLKEAMKQAKDKANNMVYYSQSGESAEVEYKAQSLGGNMKAIISANAAMGEDYDIKKCLNDYTSTVGAANQEYYGWGCNTEWTGELLANRSGLQNQIDKLAKQIELKDCEKDDDTCKNQKTKWDNQKKMVEGRLAHVKSLSGDNAKLYAHVNFGTGGACLNKWLNSNAEYQRHNLLEKAINVCAKK